MANENTAVEKRPEYLLEVKGLKKYFDVTHGFSFGKEKQYVRAVDGVSFAIRPGETLGLVGKAAAANPPQATASSACWTQAAAKCCLKARIFPKCRPKS